MPDFLLLHWPGFFAGHRGREFGLVQLMIAAHEHVRRHEKPRLACFLVLRVDHQRQRLDFVLRRDTQISRDFFDRLLPGRVNFKRFAVSFRRKVLNSIEL